MTACPVQGLKHMVGLLDIAALRPAVLEGLVASIGGLDGSLSAATTCAMVQWLAAGGSGLRLEQPHSYVAAAHVGRPDVAACCLPVSSAMVLASSAIECCRAYWLEPLEGMRHPLPCACAREATRAPLTHLTKAVEALFEWMADPSGHRP